VRVENFEWEALCVGLRVVTSPDLSKVEERIPSWFSPWILGVVVAGGRYSIW
jgi:hypothetical protein